MDKQSLDTLYNDFRQAANAVFAGKTVNIAPLHNASTKIVTFLDRTYTREQLMLDAKLKSADQKESATVKWSLILSFTRLYPGNCRRGLVNLKYFFSHIET